MSTTPYDPAYSPFGTPAPATPGADPFATPDDLSTRFDMETHLHALVLIWPLTYEDGIVTSFGTKDAVRARIVVLDGPDTGAEYADALIFGGVLVGRLRGALGQVVLGRIGQATSKPGQRPAWTLIQPTDADKATGRAWLAQAVNGAPTPASTAPATPPGMSGWGQAPAPAHGAPGAPYGAPGAGGPPSWYGPAPQPGTYPEAPAPGAPAPPPSAGAPGGGPHPSALPTPEQAAAQAAALAASAMPPEQGADAARRATEAVNPTRTPPPPPARPTYAEPPF